MYFWKNEKNSMVLKKKNVGHVPSLADEQKSNLAHERRPTRETTGQWRTMQPLKIMLQKNI